MNRFWIALVGALLVVGSWQLGRGAWIQAKAALAQVLIAKAWARTLAGEAKVKPWPWADTWPVAKLRVPRLGLERYVLAGANGASIAFAFLREMKTGDVLVIERPDGARLTYRVGSAEVLNRQDVWAMAQAGPTRLTLVTCYPSTHSGRASRCATCCSPS